jgi:hypothetical protein
MTNITHELLPVQTATLLLYYGFDLKGQTAAEWVEQWTTGHSPYWVRLAVVEAIYQGRYKAISVEHILERWSQKGHPGFHFTHDFECLVCRNIPEALALSSSQSPKIKSFNPPKTAIALTPLDRLFPDVTKPIQLPATLANRADTQPANSNIDLPVSDRLLPTLSPRTSQLGASRSGIHRFIPRLDDSELYNKLRWVVHQELAQKLGT